MDGMRLWGDSWNGEADCIHECGHYYNQFGSVWGGIGRKAHHKR